MAFSLSNSLATSTNIPYAVVNPGDGNDLQAKLTAYAGNVPIFIPKGTYSRTGNFSVPVVSNKSQNIILMGNGWETQLVGDGSSTNPVLSFANSQWAPSGHYYAYMAAVENLRITGSGAETAGLDMPYMYPYIKNVWIDGYLGSGGVNSHWMARLGTGGGADYPAIIESLEIDESNSGSDVNALLLKTAFNSLTAKCVVLQPGFSHNVLWRQEGLYESTQLLRTYLPANVNINTGILFFVSNNTNGKAKYTYKDLFVECVDSSGNNTIVCLAAASDFTGLSSFDSLFVNPTISSFTYFKDAKTRTTCTVRDWYMSADYGAAWASPPTTSSDVPLANGQLLRVHNTNGAGADRLYSVQNGALKYSALT